MSGGDDRDRDERPRRSWREIDRMRDGAGGRAERRPRGAAAEARAGAATEHYLRQMDQKLFSKQPGGAAAEQAARAVSEALGTPELDRACREYLECVGPPRTGETISAFLDARDTELVARGLRALEEEVAAGRVAPGAGLRAQLRILAEGSNDALAESAEAILERL